ncbi:MAG: DnaD domain protein [Oscillospiraceae bacterium]|nr:DnaD domain protein [Oscillospiraceae bacterium]
MNFRINPALQWGAVFSVPAVAVDKYIKVAGPQQLKALLWVLRHASEEVRLDELCSLLKCDEGDAADYLSFWAERGILLTDAPETAQTPILSLNITTPGQSGQTTQAEPPPLKKTLEPLPVLRPTHEQITARAKESPEIAFLFNEAQKKLGRTIGFDGQCALLMLHDQYGLPVEVILMIIEYCASVGKTAHGYITAMGRDWAEREIDTIDKADEQISVLRQCGGAWRELAKLAGIANPRPTGKQSEYLRAWQFELGFTMDMIFAAYEEMANRCTKLSFAYMDKVLRSWHGAGLETPEDVAKAAQARTDKPGKAAKSKESPKKASYDLEEYEQTLYEPIIYEKKKKRA